MSISFFVELRGETKQVVYNEDMTCENFIKDFLNKNNYEVTLDPEKLDFLYNGRLLNSDRFKNKTLKEINLKPGTTVYLKELDHLVGCGPMEFTDVSKKNVISRGISSSAPDYRLLKKGINIYGICKTKNCVACDKKVISSYRKDKIDIVSEKYNLRCPKCEGIIEPKTVGFYLCKYKIYGAKIENDKIVSFDNGISDANDKNNSSYFDEVENGKTTFTKLIFEVISYH